MVIATYGRVSKLEQARDTDALVRQKWQLERATTGLEEVISFVDIQTGKRDDRPDFLRLLAAIESKSITAVYVTRIDRITRDLETNAKLAKQLERTGVHIHEIMLGRSIDWMNPNDWEYFVRAGVKAEAESRMLSARIKQTFDWHRSQGKPAGGRVGFPYEHSKEGFIQRRDSDWLMAIGVIKIVVEEGGSTTRAHIRIREELGMIRTRVWLHQWIRSPLLRGHTCRNTRTKDGRKRKRGDPIELLYDTHESLFDDPELLAIDALKAIEDGISFHTRKRGGSSSSTTYPLSGLVICGRCGSNGHVRKVSQKWLYIVCSARAMGAVGCGGEYGAMKKGTQCTVSTRYIDADIAVRETIRLRGSELAKLALSSESSPMVDPKIAKLQSEIRNLEALKDPDLKPVIDKKASDLNRLLLAGNIKVSDTREKLLISLGSSEHFWDTASEAEKSILYRDFVRSVSCDRDQIIVTLTV